MSSIPDAALARLGDLVRPEPLEHPRYRFGDLLGQGGMGAVYQAYDRELDRDVAIKVVRSLDLEASSAARLEQEARLLGRLDHPGLVPVHDRGVLSDGRPFYVMRLIRGERLDHHLDGESDLGQRLRTFLKICEPVAYAHAQGVIHRDLKPANVMVGPFGEVLVLDWGIAKVRARPEPVGSAGPPPGLATGAGAVLGTQGFMAPEQALGDSERVDHRADVYSLGAILAALIGGDRPARALASIEARAMAPELGDRYQSVGELADDVARWLDGRPVRAHRESWPERLARVVRRNRTAIGLIGAYLLMRLALLAWRR